MIDGSYTTYSYDNDSQLAGSLGYTAGGSPVASQQLGFTYDAGFNMSTESVNGTPKTYTVNSLNELTAEGATAFTYDANGNRATSSAQNLTYTYDEEQRLAQVSDNVNHTFQTTFYYDGLGRLRQRFESVWASTGGGGNGPQNSQPDVMGGNYQWMPLYSISYIYDGKRVIQERDVNNTPLVGYTRGNDLSGSLEGAGGIGGLLARSYGYSGGNWTAHSYYHADGNGNITYLVNSSQGLAASYRYDPYGNTIASSGTLAATNVHRFSSKECHVDSGMYYFLYRFYDPAAQRWLNRDPIGELGGFNLYRYVGNSPLVFIDPFGRNWTIIFGTVGGIIGGMVGGGVSIILDVGTVGINIPGTPAEIAIGVALFGAAGGWVGSWFDGPINATIYTPLPYPPIQGPAGDTVIGGKQTTTYGPDGWPVVQHDEPHHGQGDHCHDWTRPPGGGPPVGPRGKPNPHRRPPRPPHQGDPPAP